MKKVYEKNVGEDARGEALYTRVPCKRQACAKLFTPVAARHVFCSDECSRAPFAPAQRKFCRRTECFAKLPADATGEFCTPECESRHSAPKPLPRSKRAALERKRIRDAFAVAAASNEAAEPEVAELPPDVKSEVAPGPLDFIPPPPVPTRFRVHVHGLVIDCSTLEDIDALVQRYGATT